VAFTTPEESFKLSSSQTDHETWENLVEDLRIDDVIQHGLHMVV